MTDKNGNRVTWRDLYQTMDSINVRFRRVEIALVVLLFATASPKFNGPTLPGVIAWAWRVAGLG